MPTKNWVAIDKVKLFRWLAAALLTLVLSVILMVRTIGTGLGAMSVQNGNWVTNVSTGSADAGVMLKATIAIGGLLASTRENSMYYRLNSVAGEPLRLNCRYRVEGDDCDADWWSITAYGWDNYLIPNRLKRYSFNNENILRREDGSWVIHVAAEEQPGNWLPVGPSGAPNWRKLPDYDFDLLLRLYTPGQAYLETPQSAPQPGSSLRELHLQPGAGTSGDRSRGSGALLVHAVLPDEYRQLRWNHQPARRELPGWHSG